jgi:hypothetical protein
MRGDVSPQPQLSLRLADELGGNARLGALGEGGSSLAQCLGRAASVSLRVP